jgi:hypothetical protein
MAYRPIVAVQTLNGVGVPAQDRLGEKASQTFKQGVPLVLSSLGFLQEAAFGAAEIVVGVSVEPGHNLTTAATAEQGTSEGTPPNQASARIIPVGAWMRDGLMGFYKANSNNVFLASLKSGQTYDTAYLLASTYYGLTKDGTTGYWYIDLTDTAGDNAVVQLVGGVSDDATSALFIFKSALRYYQ